jgi:hypothetical protein
MVVSFGPFGERRRCAARPSAGKSGVRRASRFEAGPVLLVAVLGSVAFLLWQAQRRQRRAALAPGSLIRPPPAAGGSMLEPLAPLKSAPAPELGSSMFRETGADPDDVELADVWDIPSYGGVTLTRAHRAAMAVHHGRPSELRRIALEMHSEGQDSEAGLLNNYALLLERSSHSRARVLAEVTRMLHEASAERRTSASQLRGAQRSREAPSASEMRPGAPAFEVEASGVPATDEVALVPMPVLAIGGQRRTG